jgi:hypothetical protein
MDVQVVDRLQTLLAVIDDIAKALWTVLAADVGGDEEQVSQHLLRRASR